MQVDVHNNWVRCRGVDPALAQALDREFRYPTEAARLGGGEPVPDGAWDGWIRLWYPDRVDGAYAFPTGLLPMMHVVCRTFGRGYDLHDHRVRPDPGEPLGAPIPLRDYQTEAVEAALKAGRGVVDCPPRSGKTRLMAEIVRRLGLPVLWTGPTDRIVKQTVATLSEFYGAHRVRHLVGTAAEDEARDVPAVVATIATASRLSQAFLDGRQGLVVDEWHHAASMSYQRLFKRCPHIFYRWGMTGTHYRSGDDGLAMAALLSNVVYRITSTQLLQRGHLIPTDVCFLPPGAARLRGLGSDWNRIGDAGVWGCVPRNQLAARVSAWLAREGRKVLVLTNRKAQGNMLRDLILRLLPAKHPLARFDPVEFCSTDLARHRIDGIVAAFNGSDEVRVLIGTSMLGEGVDLPAADALVYARGERAEVSLVQNAFRVCTAADGKAGRALIVDFADGHHPVLAKHSQDRLRVYHEEPIFRCHVFDALKPFADALVAMGHVADGAAA